MTRVSTVEVMMRSRFKFLFLPYLRSPYINETSLPTDLIHFADSLYHRASSLSSWIFLSTVITVESSCRQLGSPLPG